MTSKIFSNVRKQRSSTALTATNKQPQQEITNRNQAKEAFISAFLLFIKILVVIFLCEAAIMVLLHVLSLRGILDIVLDPILLTGMATPLLYWFIVRPMTDALRRHKQAEEEKAKLLHDLGERVKELKCLYGLSKLVEQPSTSLEEIFQKTANSMPGSWQYPDITCARIVFENSEFRTDNFETSKWKQSADIKVHGEKAGVVEVYHLQERPESYEGSFLKEERELIEAITERLGKIAERKRAEQQIKQSLEEKEVLLREIHHRVKNNMQVISSLMRLQSRSIEDEKSVEIFRECQNRVKSMALIHTKLYQSESLVNIDFAEYVKELTQNLMDSYDIEPGKIALTIDVEKVSLGVDLATPCGLLVNELISNSLKHAFPKEASGEIKIYIHPTENGQIELTVSDNGVGFPEELDFRKTNSLGMQLITSLTEGQLQGKIELNRSAGTEFKVTFDDLLNVKNELSKDKHSAESVCSTSA